tara:strand:+ start:537 stop:1202 length:666 start_codon:yes stop_codon:yes gene_type:complete
MALQNSGAISLDQIHVEANGTSGTQASLNDSDIRNLGAASGRVINSTLGTEIDFADFYGASNDPRQTFPISGSASTGNRTINVGNFSISSPISFHYYGFATTSGTGSLSSASWGGTNIVELTNNPPMFGGSSSIILRIDTPVFNSGWTSLTIYHYLSSGGPSSPITLNRTSANYTYNTLQTFWSWSIDSLTGLSYPSSQILSNGSRNTAFIGTVAHTFSIT